MCNDSILPYHNCEQYAQYIQFNHDISDELRECPWAMCDFKTVEGYQMLEHQLGVHRTMPLYHCYRCGILFITYSGLYYHESYHRVHKK